MSEPIRRLPDGELEVMQALWSCPNPAKRQDIEKVLLPVHPMALTTLLTMLSRLKEKGFLSIEKVGRSSVYIPLIQEQAYLASQSRSFLQKLCGGKLSTFAAALCGSGLTREEIDELRDLLDRGEL